MTTDTLSTDTLGTDTQTTLAPTEAPAELSPAQAAARRGAELLDERMPDWYTRINTQKLNILSPSDCICGQLYDYYSSGLFVLGVQKSPSAYGFNAAQAYATSDLHAAWRDEIARRRLSALP